MPAFRANANYNRPLPTVSLQDECSEQLGSLRLSRRDVFGLPTRPASARDAAKGMPLQRGELEKGGGEGVGDDDAAASAVMAPAWAPAVVRPSNSNKVSLIASIRHTTCPCCSVFHFHYIHCTC